MFRHLTVMNKKRNAVTKLLRDLQGVLNETALRQRLRYKVPTTRILQGICDSAKNIVVLHGNYATIVLM